MRSRVLPPVLSTGVCLAPFCLGLFGFFSSRLTGFIISLSLSLSLCLTHQQCSCISIFVCASQTNILPSIHPCTGVYVYLVGPFIYPPIRNHPCIGPVSSPMSHPIQSNPIQPDLVLSMQNQWFGFPWVSLPVLC